MKLNLFLQILYVIVIVSFSYEFLFYSLNELFVNGRLDISVYALILSLAFATVFAYFKVSLNQNQFFKYLFLSFILRIIFNPFFMYLKMKLGLAFICQKIVPPSEELLLADLLVDVSKIILIILILKFKWKDIFICSIFSFLIFVAGIFIPHRIFMIF